MISEGIVTTALSEKKLPVPEWSQRPGNLSCSTFRLIDHLNRPLDELRELFAFEQAL